MNSIGPQNVPGAARGSEDGPSIPTEMTAVVGDRYGPPTEVLRTETIEVPQIGAEEVLVRVRAAGVDRGVWHLVAGLPLMIRAVGYGLRAPKRRVPGLDLAGEVVAAGEDVTRFRVGDEVFGIGLGSFAEYAVASADKLAPKPASLSWEEAAVVPVSGLTGLQAVRDHARLRPGGHVLVLGASGGVGGYAVQVAKARGAEVTGVASGPKLEHVRSLGADHVIDYTREEITDAGRAYDAIIDIGGNRPLSLLRRVLRRDGTLVIVGGEGGGRWLGGTDRQLRALALSPFVGQKLTTFISPEKGSDLAVLAEMIEAGEVRPTVGRAYPLAAAPEAIADLESGRAEGKLAVSIAG